MHVLKPRPEVVIDNAVEVFGFYSDEYQPNKVANWVLHAAMTPLFRPHDVDYAGTAEQDIYRHLEAGGQIIVAANHTKDIDPCAIAAATIWEHALRGMVGGDTIIPSKAPIFHDLAGDHAVANWLLRHAVDILNAKPVFRKKDVPEGHPGLPVAYGLFMDMIMGQLKAEQNMVLFPEEERNKVDPKKVQSLKSGLAYMLFRLPKEQRSKVALATMGLYYGEDKRRPMMKIGELVMASDFEKRGELMDWTAASMQESVDGAIEMYEAAA